MKRLLVSLLLGAAVFTAAPAQASEEPPAPGVIASQERPKLGSDLEFTFTPSMPNTVRYGYYYDSRLSGDVWAQPDGTAKVKFRVVNPYYNHLLVRGYTATGEVSGLAEVGLTTLESFSTIERDGDRFKFTTTTMERLASYTIRLDDKVIAVLYPRPDNSAELEWPIEPGDHHLRVETRTTDHVPGFGAELYWTK